MSSLQVHMERLQASMKHPIKPNDPYVRQHSIPPVVHHGFWVWVSRVSPLTWFMVPGSLCVQGSGC